MDDHAFLIELPADPYTYPTEMTEHWVIRVDYTKLLAVEAQETLA